MGGLSGFVREAMTLGQISNFGSVKTACYGEELDIEGNEFVRDYLFD